MSAEPKVLILSRPVQAHGEEIKELRFREPTGNDAWECGMPIRFNNDNEIIIAMPAMMSLAARLAAVPLSTIKSLPLSDVMRMVEVLTGFLTQEVPAPAPLSGRSTSPGSGKPTPVTSLRSA
jgi:hypothetical protein